MFSLETIYTCDLTQHYKFIEGLQSRQGGDLTAKTDIAQKCSDSTLNEKGGEEK